MDYDFFRFDCLFGLPKRYLVALIAVLFVCPGPALADQDLAREHVPESWKTDAELTDVFFLDAKLGWAVGAQGVILRTTDGGQEWREISQVEEFSPVDIPLAQKIRMLQSGIQTNATGVANDSSAHRPIRCRFESVCFIDPMHGWIAGGYQVPYVGRSRAVVMRTKDGGVTWSAVRNLVIPRINKIVFSSPQNGWAVGETGNLFQTGIFQTSDGGHTWSSQSAEHLPGWVDGQLAGNGFVTLDAMGRPGVVQSSTYEASVILQDTNVVVNQLRMINAKSGWAVGERGAVLQTVDGGVSWTPLDLAQTANLIREFDLKTVSVSAGKIWCAGDPGSFLFSINRVTGAVNAHATTIQTRINQVHFVDDQNGWAVGGLGSIIATQDGGATWQLQRGQHRRVAMLSIAANTASIPFELMAQYASEEDHLCASVVWEDVNSQNQIAAQAVERLGVVMSSSPSLSGQETATDREAYDLELEKMVRLIRTQQPNVIVCSPDLEHKSRYRRTGILFGLVEEAIRKSADRNAFPAQIVDAGLKTWQVDRLATLDATGSVSVDAGRMLPRTGALVEDQISISRGLVGQPILVNRNPLYRVSHYSGREQMRANNLVSGLGGGSGVPSREKTGANRGNLMMIQQATAKRRKFAEFERFEAKTPQDKLIWRQQIESFAMKMEKDVAGVWLMQLAERYLAVGKTELAAEACKLLVMRWSDHAFSPAAYIWLGQYYGSDEFGQIEYLSRVNSGQWQPNGRPDQPAPQSGFVSQPKAVSYDGMTQLTWTATESLAGPLENAPDKKLQPVTDEESTPISRPEFFDDRLKTASHFLTQLRQRDPELAAGPQYQWLESQLARRIEGKISNEARLKNLVQANDFSTTGISIGAVRELGLGGKLSANAQSISTWVCQQTNERPKLDGQLNEPFWKNSIAKGNVVRSTVRLAGTPVAQVSNPTDLAVFAYDEQFFYAGFTCHKIPGQYYNARKDARPRDADLSRRDRVELILDLDRDYRSGNRFVIDHRGWVHESCGGSVGWNPDWFVSQSENETSWTIELAIPLESLLPGPLAADSIWAIHIARHHAYDDENLWAPPANSASRANSANSANSINGVSESTTVTKPVFGLQNGFTALPAQFELIRFEPAENNLENRLTPIGVETNSLAPTGSWPTRSAPTDSVPTRLVPADFGSTQDGVDLTNRIN